jgi:hypothetical protein
MCFGDDGIVKTLVREAFAIVDHNILCLSNVWQEVEYRFDTVRDISGAHIELN